MIVLKENLTRVIFPSLYNIVVRYYLVIVLEGNLKCVGFTSWCNVFDGNVVVPKGKLTCVRFHSS